MFIGLIDIFITSIVFHSMISPKNIFYQINLKKLLSRSHLEHTIIPIFYLFFYFLFPVKTIPYKHIWIAWIHPSIYFIFFCFYGYFNLNNYLSNDSKIISDPTQYYPYPFLAPLESKPQITNENKKITFKYKGYFPIFKCFIILFSIFTFSTYVLLFLKKYNLNEYD